jgi:hypothetical protein
MREANTPEEKAFYKHQIHELEQEFRRTDEGIHFLLKNQVRLFGLRRKR